MEQQLELALAAQVDDDVDEDGTADLDIPDYNGANEIIPQTLQKVNEDDAEDGGNSFDNTMKSGTMQKLIKTPGSKSKKSKMAVTPKNRKASTTKSEDLKNHLKAPQSSKNDA